MTEFSGSWPRGSALAAALILIAHDAGHRTPASAVAPRDAEPSSVANTIYDITTSERWMHGRESPEFTAPERSTRWVSIEGDARGTGGSRILSMRFSNPYVGRSPATVALDSRGRLMKVSTSLPPREHTRYPLFTPHQELLRQFLDGETRTTLALPASRVWDLIPTRAPRGVRAGDSWRDTVDLHASAGLFLQRFEGVRTSTIMGDTLLGSHRYAIVRDSALVRYYESSEREERTLDTFVVIERQATGTIVGRYLVDSAAGVFHVRDDTTRLAGTAIRKYPDGRKFETPARFERTRHIAHYSSAGYDSLIAERSSHDEQFSIIARPVGIEEGVLAGDARVVDSLLTALSTSRDPDERRRIRFLFRRWSRKDSDRRTLQRIAFAGGDLAFGLEEANERWERGDPMDSATMRQLLKVLADPGYAFSLSIEPDVYYERVNDALHKRPPAVTPDTSKWPCAPEACRILAAEWPAANDPRLRALALVARFAMDPATMCDSVFVLSRHVPMMMGVQTLAIASSDRRCGGVLGVLPRRGASWRAWRRWQQTVEEWVYNPRVPAGDARLRSDSSTLFHMAERVSGRDLEGEWHSAFSQARTDSARSAYGSLLAVLGVVPESSSQIADRIESASPRSNELGMLEMMTLFSSRTHPADSALAEEVVGTLLATALDGTKSWPLLRPSSARDSALNTPHRVVQALDGAYGPGEKPVSAPIILVRSGIPPGVLAAMERRGVLVVDSGFALPSSESALELLVEAPQAVGPLLVISLAHYHEAARINGRGQSWASKSTYYLLHTRNGWRIVGASSWIT